jgi:catechol 2,3-dioxygenase-like lactoylglutathione lyase family enzyme
VSQKPITKERTKRLEQNEDDLMDLGCFSVSLAVKDLEASRAFYEKLGFTTYAGQPEHNYLIMQNGTTNIGLFQGMFEDNILTFNPGWDQSAKDVDPFTDVREMQAALKAKGIAFVAEAEQGTEGPAHFIIQDPDGNTIMVDQHR